EIPSLLLPVRIANRGSHALAHAGPARWVLHSWVVDELGQRQANSDSIFPLTRVLAPGKALSAAIAVPVPAVPGSYRVGIRVEPADSPSTKNLTLPEAWMTLTVEAREGAFDERCCGPMLDAAQAALVEANRLQALPDHYVDVTQGWLASCKRWIKRKLLNNFKKAYVDVISRQQSAFNRQMLTALAELAECCTTLDHVRTAATPFAGGSDVA